MKYDCLIIDDEKELANNTAEYFNMFDVKTVAVYSSAEANEFLKNNEPSLVLLDINLSDGSGFRGEGGEGFLRMNLACPRSVLADGLSRLERFASGLS